MIWGMRTENTAEATSFFRVTSERMQNPGMVNPYKYARIHLHLSRKSLLAVFDAEFKYPRIYLLGVFFLLSYLCLYAFNIRVMALLFVGYALCATVWLWTASFQYMIARRGLRKAGYKGEVSRLGSVELVRYYFEHGTK